MVGAAHVKALPWLGLGVVGATLGVTALQAGPALWLDPTRTDQPWRWLTCHLVHHDARHLLWDTLAFAVLAAALESRSRGRLAVTLGVSALGVAGVVGASLPAGGVYGGLSGVDAALLTALAASLLATPGKERAVGGVLAVGFGVKLLLELLTGAVAFAGDGVIHVPLAHGVGAVAGLLAHVAYPTRRVGSA